VVDELAVSCGRRYFRNQAEYEKWFEIRVAGFTEWYVPRHPTWSPRSNRHIANCIAYLFPEFHHQLRTSDGTAIGYLSTVPGYWSGEVESLHDFQYIDDIFKFSAPKLILVAFAHMLLVEWLHMPKLFEPLARKVRAKRLSEAHAIFLLAISVAPEYRKHKLPTMLIGAAKEAAGKLGFRYVMAPFRPNAYGKYKAERRTGHSEVLFNEYCSLKNAEGLPADPWLRTVVRLGARLLKPVQRSLTLKGDLSKFEGFRATFRPDDWYSPGKDVWECGETSTWYVDPARRIAVSVEPNYWGVIDLREQAAGG